VKIPFTCSYLPGKGNVQYVFWACVLVVVPLIYKGAGVEMQMLHRAVGFGVMLVVLAAAWGGVRWAATVRVRSTVGMRFDEVMAPLLMTVSLRQPE
jgi:hypothetical protein